MEKSRKMMVNTILLTLSSLVMRGIGLTFQVYLSQRVGAAGIGLFTLIMSVNLFAATVAISGIRFATTRLVSEELGKKSGKGAEKTVVRCCIYGAVFGTFALLMLTAGADFIGNQIIRDGRTVMSLRILALSLPFLSMGAVFSGYFIAVCRVTKSAAIQLSEQMIRICAIVFFLSMIDTSNVELACAAIVAGGASGEIGSFFVALFLYLADKEKLKTEKGKSDGHITKRMFGIALPLAFTAYARTALSALQNIMVPSGLKKNGSSYEAALADYGMIQGMVFPIVTFPSALVTSLSEIMVPELTEAQVRGEKGEIRTLSNRILRLCAVFAIGVAGMLFSFSEELGTVIYNDIQVGKYIWQLSLLVPVMYMDSVTDGMLRGLGQHLHSMRYNILDSLLSLAMVYYLLPKYAVKGYIFIMYFSEIFNFSLSIRRLGKVTEIKVKLKALIYEVLAVFGGAQITKAVFMTLNLATGKNGISLTLAIVLSVVIYIFILKILGALESGDIAWLRSMFEGNAHKNKKSAM